MYYLLVLALAVCAHGSEVPDYLNAYSNFRLSAATLERHILTNDTDTPTVGYMVLMTSLGLVANAEVFLKMKYEQSYELAVLLGEVFGRLYPEVFQRFAKVKLAKARRGTAKLMKIIQDHCQLRADFTRMDLREWENATNWCDEIVDPIVEKDEELKQEATLLLAISDLSFTFFIQNYYVLFNEISKGKINEYLEKEKKEIKPLVEELVKVIDMLFKKDNEQSWRLS